MVEIQVVTKIGPRGEEYQEIKVDLLPVSGTRVGNISHTLGSDEV